MKTAHIINYQFFDEKGQNVTIGGVQTYIVNLSRVLNKLNYQVLVHQTADIDFIKTFNNVTVKGYACKLSARKRPQFMYNKYISQVSPESDIIIFTDELLSVRCHGIKTITVEHGIGWDIPDTKHSRFGLIVSFFKKTYHSYYRIKHSSRSDLLVCVDYNFMNWYRACVVNHSINYSVIPNFTEIADYNHKPQDRVNIIFARRLVEYRGTKVFARAIKRVLYKYGNYVKVTIAGDGPDYEWMKEYLLEYKNDISFITYSSKDSLIIHADKNIAVVPTVGSEGTSLSLLEAMASQCAVICTDVGGMTNIVIDRYNGLMVKAGDEESLYNAIDELIENSQLRTDLALKGYDVVKSAFSFERWARQWKTEIKALTDDVK